MTTAAIRVQLVAAERDSARVESVSLASGATVQDALAAAGIVHEGEVGVWGKRVERDAPLADGDRVELYRALIADPKQARHRRASQQGYRWQGRTRRVARAAQQAAADGRDDGSSS